MGVPLVQQVSEVHGHVPRCSLQLVWVHLPGLQPLQIQHVLLTVGQLVNTGRDSQGGRKTYDTTYKENKVAQGSAATKRSLCRIKSDTS